jgi:hypothetical protein
MIILGGKGSLTPGPSPKREGDLVESVEFRVERQLKKLIVESMK